MNKYKHIFFSVLALALMAIPAMAQGAADNGSDNASTVAAYKAIAAGIGFGIAAGLGGLGQGKIGAAAVEGAARNPGAAGNRADDDDYRFGTYRIARAAGTGYRFR